MKKRFRLIAVLTAFALTVSGLGMNSKIYGDDVPDAVEYDPGDVNFDNVIDAADALETLKHAAKLLVLGEYNYIRADVDNNKAVDATDALYILQYAADLITSFDEVKVTDAPLEPTDEPTPVPTKTPTGYELYDSIDVELDYTNSFVVELTSTEAKTYTVEDFKDVALTDVWTRGKMKTETGFVYELVMVLDENTSEDDLAVAMEKVKAMEGVIAVVRNDYVERDTILELNHSEYILEVGESIELNISDYRPFDASTNDSCLIIDFNQDTINGEDISLETFSEYGIKKLVEGSYVMTGSSAKWEENLITDFYAEAVGGWGDEISYLTVAHLLSQLPEVDMVQVVRTTFPTGARYYENWIDSDESIASMVLSGGDYVNGNLLDETKLNQTATITGVTPGEVTISVTKGGWGNKEATATCVIKVVEADSVVYEAKYPELSAYVHEEADRELYNKWRDDRSLQTQAYRNNYRGTLDDFYKAITKGVLGKDTNENLVVSPVNVYMALAMLSETVDGSARTEILDLIGTDNVEELRKQANAVWNANYCDDGTVVSILGNSLWLNDDVQYKTDTLKTLSDNYYASSFRGNMGSENYNVQLRNWLNEQTGGKLENQIADMKLSPEAVLAMYSTIYYRGKWDEKFYSTTKDIFNSPDGEVECEYLVDTRSWQDYFWADKFAAINKEITYGGKMWVILPDEGVSVQEVINEAEYMKLVLDESDWENKRDDILVNVKFPKFDVVSDIELEENLKSLGIDEIFSTEADFSPLMENEEDVFISDINHKARVSIDEEGCEATAFTEVIYAGAPMPPEDEVDFIADRPFIFVITSEVGTPLFVGVVNNP